MTAPLFERATRAIAATAAILTVAACGPAAPPAPPAQGPLPVTAIEVQPQRVPNFIEVPAQTEGAQEAAVRARVGGVLQKRLYREGEPVAAGQALFQIDRAPYEIALQEARARFDQAAREMKRLQPLAEAKAVSQREYDDAVSAHALAQAGLRAAELNLEWTTVTAPVAGISGRAVKSEGSLVSVGADSLLTTVYQINPMWARFSLGESDRAKLPGGKLDAKSISSVELVLPDGSTYPRPGRVNFLAGNIDPALGAQQLRAEFDNADRALMPGQFVRVRVITGAIDQAFLLPQSAVLSSAEGTLVMVVGAENKVEPRPVKPGAWRGKDWVILGGLKAGDKVIVDNLLKLRPGMAVAPHGPAKPADSR